MSAYKSTALTTEGASVEVTSDRDTRSQRNLNGDENTDAEITARLRWEHCCAISEYMSVRDILSLPSCCFASAQPATYWIPAFGTNGLKYWLAQIPLTDLMDAFVADHQDYSRNRHPLQGPEKRNWLENLARKHTGSSRTDVSGHVRTGVFIVLSRRGSVPPVAKDA